MTLEQQLRDDLKQAMLAGDDVRKRTLRMALAAIKNEKVRVGGELEDQDVVVILQKEAKQRQETLEELTKIDRPALEASEKAELEILESYLPRQLDREEIAAMARQVIADVKAESPRQMGQVMGILMPQLKGQADGKLVSQVVRELLNK
jgi:uncharacterized protein YqeY